MTETSSESSPLWILVYILFALLVGVGLYILLLLVIWSGASKPVASCVASTSCRRYKRHNQQCFNCARAVTLRASRIVSCSARLVIPLVHRRMIPVASSRLCVVEEQWGPLWVREAPVMSRAVRHYHRCVRHAIVQHECYEMESVEGMFVVVCPSASVGVHFGCDVIAEVARLTKRDADVLAAKYKAFGHPCETASGLHLRTSLHSGVASRSVDAVGRVLWTGAAVTGAVCATHLAGTGGMMVLTENATRMMEAEHVDLGEHVNLGKYSLGRDSTVELLLLAIKVLSCTSAHSQKPAQHRHDSITVALRLMDLLA